MNPIENKPISMLLNGSAAFLILNFIFECAVLFYENEVKVLTDDFHSVMDIKNLFVIFLFLTAVIYAIIKRKEMSNYLKQNKELFKNEFLIRASIVVPFIFLPTIVEKGIFLGHLFTNPTGNTNLVNIILQSIVFGIALLVFLLSITKRKDLRALLIKNGDLKGQR